MTLVYGVLEPSVVDLARGGNYRALAYWINTHLLPQGIIARVEDARAGCLQILVELQQGQSRETIVKSICHQIWRLNSDVIDGVSIMARLAGHSDILWKQSVRIVTPANQQRPKVPVQQKRAHSIPLASGDTFKMLRSLLVVGTAVTSFILGYWFTSRSTLSAKLASTPIPSPAATILSHPIRPKEVKAALETVPVKYLNPAINPEDPVVTLMFAGDVTLSDSFADVAGKDYKWAFSQLEEYRKADVAMVNLENPLTDATRMRPGKSFNFKADPKSVEFLTAGGVDIVNLANNHTMDYEADGLKETLETLDKAGIHYVGAGRDIKEARRPEIIEVKGQRIAYLGYYDPGFHPADKGTAGTNPSIEDQIAQDIKAIRNQVDWIIVNYHWGVELAEYPQDWQRELAKFTIDQGADVVVGHHPHVLQGAEIYKDRPIAYSLGNFIFGGNSRSDYDTAVLKVSLKGKQMKVEFLPVEVRQYQPKVVKGERGESILNQIHEISHIFDRPMTSPTILKTRRLQSADTAASPAPSPASPTFAAPANSPVPFDTQPIQMPVFPPDMILKNNFNDPEQPQNGKEHDSLPQSGPVESGKSDPFSKESFIKAPLPTTPPRPAHQSQLPATPSPSFTVSSSRRTGRNQAIQLPVLA
jgi:poly-gamma-glutamate synthesis protein (capsule biosynthesis protein)